MDANQRAAQIWPVLAWTATNRQTITYGDLGKLIGVPAPGLGQLLEPVHAYCIAHRLPPLTAVVVNAETGMPGSGFTAAAEVPSAQQRVFRHDWLATRAPSSEQLATASAEGKAT